VTSIRPQSFAHVVYRTRRFKEMLKWYETVFGAKVQFQNPVLAFLTYDDEHHRFALADMATILPESSETERHGEIGVDHVAYTYASVSDLLETYGRLKEENITPYWCVHHGITVSLYYADPDGNQMEFQVDAFESSAEAADFMKTKWDANTIGVEFDPQEWLTRLRAGAPESEFLQRRVHQPESPLRGELEKMLSGK
jgi:catechol-2,3-dioxygenase